VHLNKGIGDDEEDQDDCMPDGRKELSIVCWGVTISVVAIALL
jgi:hypothetical protein